MTRQPSWAYLALFATLTGVAQTKAQFVPLSLTVVDAAGGKVAEAFISIDNTSTSARTDIDGNAKLSLPPGSYGVSINAAGFLSKSAHIDLKEAKEQRIELAVAGMCSPCLTIEDPLANLETTGVPLTALLPYAQSTPKMTPASSVTLRFTDQSKAPIPGVQITLARPPDTLETGKDGQLMLELKPGEYTIHAAMAGFSSLDRSFQVSGPESQPIDFTLRVGPTFNPVVLAEPQLQIVLPPNDRQAISQSALKALPQKTVTFHNVHTKADETYTGVSLTDLLAKFGAPTGDKLRGKGLSDYIIATGSDGYKAVLSLAETDPAFHPGDVIVADTLDGKPIGDKDGPFKLVVTEDKRPARCVHNLVSIELRAAE